VTDHPQRRRARLVSATEASSISAFFRHLPAFAAAAALLTPCWPRAAEAGTSSTSGAEGSSRVENAVVKVFSTVRAPDILKPWTKQAPHEITGSGVVIEGKRVLTNAHVVLYASQVQVQANQAGDKISATVEAIAPGIDLAVLKLEDESFFDTHQPLERATVLPEAKDVVMAYGFPTGGTSLSITKGIVSRIEFTSYHFPVSGLRIQIDAAINPGNSGGPAVSGDKMIGLAFSALGGAQNIGYIIPCEEIELFLKDVSDGRYDGKPAMFDVIQTLENPALRAFLKLDRSVEGVVVHQPFGTDPGYPLKEWDVITRIGDAAVDDQGMVRVGRNLRVYFTYMVQKAARDGKVALTVVRAGKEMVLSLPVSPTRPMVVPDLLGAYPSYFIYGPMVFSKATMQLLGAVGGGPSRGSQLVLGGSPLVSRLFDLPAFEGEELVVVPSPLFPHKLSKGYSNPMGQVVKSVNGVRVKNLRHLVELLRDARTEFITVDFLMRGGESLVLPRKETLAATEELITDNGIRSQGSPDTLGAWGAKAPQ